RAGVDAQEMGQGGRADWPTLDMGRPEIFDPGGSGRSPFLVSGLSGSDRREVNDWAGTTPRTGLVSAPRPSGAPRPRGPGPHAFRFRRQPHLEPHVQARVVLLDLVGAVLGSKLSHDPSDPLGIGDGACPDARPAPSCPETDRGDPPSVLVPLGLG